MATQISSLVVSLQAETASLKKDLNRAKKLNKDYAKSAKKSADTASKAFRRVGTALAGIASLSVAKNLLSTSDALVKSSRAAGVAFSQFQKLRFGLEQSGVSGARFEKAMVRMGKVLFDAERGTKTATDALAELGLEYSDLANLAPEEQFELIVRELDNIDDAGRRAAVSQELLGRGFGEVKINMDAVLERGGKLYTVTENAAEASERFNDSMGLFSINLQNAATNAIAPFADAMVPLLDSFDGERVQRWVHDVLYGFASIRDAIKRGFGAIGLDAPGLASILEALATLGAMKLFKGGLRGRVSVAVQGLNDATNRIERLSKSLNDMNGKKFRTDLEVGNGGSTGEGQSNPFFAFRTGADKARESVKALGREMTIVDAKLKTLPTTALIAANKTFQLSKAYLQASDDVGKYSNEVNRLGFALDRLNDKGVFSGAEYEKMTRDFNLAAANLNEAYAKMDKLVAHGSKWQKAMHALGMGTQNALFQARVAIAQYRVLEGALSKVATGYDAVKRSAQQAGNAFMESASRYGTALRSMSAAEKIRAAQGNLSGQIGGMVGTSVVLENLLPKEDGEYTVGWVKWLDEKLSNAFKTVGFSESAATVGSQIAITVGAAIASFAVIGAIAGAVQAAIVAAFSTVAAGIGALILTPVGLIAGVVIATIASALAIEHWNLDELVGGWASGLAQKTLEYFGVDSELANKMAGFFDGLIRFALMPLKTIGKLIKAMWSEEYSIADALGDTRAEVGAAAQLVVDAIKAPFIELFEWIGEQFRKLGSKVKEMIEGTKGTSKGRRDSRNKGKGYATGGFVSGAGTATSDSIPAMLSNGEYVIQASTVGKFGKGFFDLINRGVMPVGRSSGGIMGDYSGDRGYALRQLRTLLNDDIDDSYQSHQISELSRYIKQLGEAVLRGNKEVVEATREQTEVITEDNTATAGTSAGSRGGAGSGSGGNSETDNLAEDFKSNFAQSLRNALISGDPKDFLHGVVDQLTNKILDSFVDGFTSSLFENIDLNGILGNLFNSIGSSGSGGGGLGNIIGGLFNGILGMNDGGVVPHTPYSKIGRDSVPAMLTPGEVVIPTDQVGKGGGTTVVNLSITGDVTRQTRKEVLSMLPEITSGVNVTNKERGYR